MLATNGIRGCGENEGEESCRTLKVTSQILLTYGEGSLECVHAVQLIDLFFFALVVSSPYDASKMMRLNPQPLPK